MDMHIELRSHLAIGVATALSATAFALTPVAGTVAPVALDPSAVEVALAGIANPLTELAGTVELISSDLFGTGSYSYPFPIYTGIVPQFISDALPIIRQLGANAADYIGNSVEALISGPDSTLVTLATAAWTLLPNAIDSGVGPALQTFAAQISAAGQTALDAGGYVLTGVANHLLATLGGIAAYAVPNLLFAAVGAVSAVATAAGTVASQFVGAVADLDAEAAWNIAVAGLLGPRGADGKVTSSIPGTLEAVTIGNGIGLYGSESYVPSLRIAVQSAVYATANNLGGNYPRPTTPLVPTPSATVAAAAEAHPAAVAPRAVVERVPPATAEPQADEPVSSSVRTRMGTPKPGSVRPSAPRAAPRPAAAQPHRR
jgi:hypothetical protein